MDNNSIKSSKSRDNINNRMQGFMVPNNIEPKNMFPNSNHGIDKDYYNYKPETSNQQRSDTLQKSDFKNDTWKGIDRSKSTSGIQCKAKC